MALVAYEYGSESEPDITDEEEEVSKATVLSKENDKVVIAPCTSTTNGSSFSNPTSKNLFSLLPEAKPCTVSSTVEEESDQLEDFIPTVKTIKEKKKVQITIPSLSDFDDLNDDEGPAQKRAKPSAKGSGLLSMLPPVQTVPKSNTMFVPNTVAKKNTATNLKPRTVAPSQAAKKAALLKKRALLQKRAENDSDTDTDSEDIPIPETFDDQMWEKVCGRPKVPKRPVIAEQEPTPIEEISCAPEPEKPYDGLDNVAFKELVGKVKRPLGNIKLIDINEEEIMPDRDLWMTKSLTDPELQPKAEADDGVDPTRKRKHHITFLAQQAKTNEQGLKAAWATSKNNRMMSRAKYGF